VGELRGRIVDAASGRPLEARVHVLASTGDSVAPEGALRGVAQRKRMLGLFGEGRQIYNRLART
jgi:hypothetical protein